MVALTYPGVYIQEVPSGVRTITGVSTSTALFVGRTERGVMNKPTKVFNFTEFTRFFGAGTEESELATAVRLFFANGGTVAIVTRIADETAGPASVRLKSVGNGDVLTITAREAGSSGGDLRVAVDYATSTPDETFNLRVFRVDPTSLQETELEVHSNLSMRPGDPRFVDDIVGQNSTLVTAKRVAGPPTEDGFSIGARVVAGTSVASLGIPDGATMRVVVDGVQADYVFDAGTGFLAMPGTLLPSVIPADTGKALFKLTGTDRTVQVIPSGLPNDVATYMQMGAARGGLEQSPYGAQRPAPTGLFTTLSHTNLGKVAALDQDDFDLDNEVDIELDGTTLPDFVLKTTDTGLFYNGNITSVDSLLNVQEKLHVLAAQFNTKAQSAANFSWRAYVEGYTLVFRRLNGGANLGAGATATSTDAGLLGTDGFVSSGNARYYSLKTGGAGSYQTGTDGAEGDKPGPGDYDKAYEVIDREVDIFNILVLPRDAKASDGDRNALWGPASVFCQRRRAVLLVDPPSTWVTAADVTAGIGGLRIGLVKDHAVLYWPRLQALNELNLVKPVDPSGAMAGVWARTDGQRGVWKAPAGLEADIRGILGTERQLSDPENGVLNPEAANAIRVLPSGIVSWGARTMDGFDNSSSPDYKYVPVRRLALYLAESLRRGLQFAVFEPNDEPLWAQIRLAAGAFMHGLFRQGAFQGQKKSDAYFVKVDAETTTQNDINLGIVNVIVGFAPLKPAEFVVIQLKQIAGQIQT